MTLEATTYSASRGYSWSSVPTGMTSRSLDGFFKRAADARGAFADPSCIVIGLVSDGRIAAAFSVQNVKEWDAENRASDYAAFVFFPVADAAQIDFVELVRHDFFWMPVREPPTSLEYDGPASAEVPVTAASPSGSQQEYLLHNPRALGAMIAKYCTRNSQWSCVMKSENIVRIECII